MANKYLYRTSGTRRHMLTCPAAVGKLWYNMRRFTEGNKTCLTQLWKTR